MTQLTTRSALAPVAEAPLQQFLAGQLSERTRKAYKRDLVQFFGSENATMTEIRQITFHDIIAFRNELAESGYKRTTINRKLSSLKAFFRMLLAAGLVENNPADATLVRGYRVEDNLTGKAISTEAIKSILQAVQAEQDDLVRSRDEALLHLLTYGGLRRSEAANMCWEDLTQEGAFTVLRLPQTKSGVPQDIKIQSVVSHYLNLYRQALSAHGYGAELKVFISLSRNDSHGKPLSDQSINLIVKKYAKRAGLSRAVTAHMFRHTCCTLAIEGGAKPQQVQAHLRHKDLKTTMRYYENREKLTDNASDYIHII